MGLRVRAEKSGTRKGLGLDGPPRAHASLALRLLETVQLIEHDERDEELQAALGVPGGSLRPVHARRAAGKPKALVL